MEKDASYLLIIQFYSIAKLNPLLGKLCVLLYTGTVMNFLDVSHCHIFTYLVVGTRYR